MSDKLYDAARNGNFEEVERLLAKGGVDLEYKDRDGRTPIIRAAYNGHTRIVYTLFISGADLHATTDDGTTAAQYARGNNHLVLAACLDRLASHKQPSHSLLPNHHSKCR